MAGFIDGVAILCINIKLLRLQYMNIVFLCGSIEPGCDGVGDYTRRLSEELAINHKISIIALNDRFVSEVYQISDNKGTQIDEYRIPESYGTNDRIAQASEWINQINPIMISLQFVIYSFNRKGLPFNLNKTIATITKGRFLHIMFHETWLGVTRVASLKDKMYGFIQQRIISSLLKTVKPRLITTSNGLYKTLLSQLHVTAKIIPLFSNIPVANKDEIFINNIYSHLQLDPSTNYYVIGVFGNIYHDSKLREALLEIEKNKVNGAKPIIVLGFGKVSDKAALIFEDLTSEFSDKMVLKHLGEFEPGQLSNLIQILDIAISPTPAKHIGKSGVYAALRLHGKKVLVPNNCLFPEYEKEIKDFNTRLENETSDFFDVKNVAKDFTILLSQSFQSLHTQKQLSTTL